MTPRERRTVRLGVVAALMIFLYVVALDPYLSARAETRAKMEETEAQLTRLRSLERSLPAYQQRLAGAQTTWNTDVRPRLLAGDLPAVSASTLSGEVRRIATQSFLEVERENVLASTDQDGLTSIPVQFSLRGDIYGLRDFLAALETSRTFLNLRELRVNSVAAGYNQGMGLSVAPLQLTVTVEGYLSGEASPVEPEAPPTEATESGTTGGPSGVGAGRAGAGGATTGRAGAGGGATGAAPGGASTGGTGTGGAAGPAPGVAPVGGAGGGTTGGAPSGAETTSGAGIGGAPGQPAPAQAQPAPTAPAQAAPAQGVPGESPPAPAPAPQQPPANSNDAAGQQ